MAGLKFNTPLLLPSTAPASNDEAVTKAYVDAKTVKIGSTTLQLDQSTTSLAGLSSVTATTFTGSLSGNASTATKLATARTINGVSFDGTKNITVSASINANDVTSALGYSPLRPDAPTVSDVDDTQGSGVNFYTYTSSSNNNPTPYGALISIGRAATYGAQIAFRETVGGVPALLTRGFSSGNFSDWGEVYHSKNIDLTNPTFSSVSLSSNGKFYSSGAEGRVALGSSDYYYHANANNAGLYSPADGYAFQWSMGSRYFKVYGDVYGTGFQITSDARLKENIRPIKARKIVDVVAFSSWDWIDATCKGPTRGAIAQTLQEIAPEYTAKDEDGYLSIDYGRAAFESTYYVNDKVEALLHYVKRLEHRLQQLEG